MPIGYAQEKELPVAEFSKAKFTEWKEVSIKGNTEYRISETDDGKILAASSRASSSMLQKSIRIDLYQFPYVNWRWRIENRLPVRNETQVSGDDYPVRLFFTVKGANQYSKTRSLHYAWTRGVSLNSAWMSATDANAVMISVNDVNSPVGQWVEQKRSLLKDIQQYIGPDVRYIDVVTIVTDTDNSHSFVNSSYGDIVFSNR